MNLTDFSYYFKKYAPIAIIGAVLFLIFVIILTLTFKAIKNKPKPQVFVPGFGKINAIQYSETFPYPPTPVFTIDNIEGRPITATNSAHLYYIPEFTTGIGYNRNVLFMGKAAGFNVEQENYTLQDTTATFENSDKKLTIDIQSFNFTLETNFPANADLLSRSVVPNESLIINSAQSFLQSMNRFPPSLSNGTFNVIYQRYDSASDTFTKVDNILDANVIEVDFFPPDVDGFPVVVPKYYNSQNYVVLAFANNEAGAPVPTILKAQVQHMDWEIKDGSPYPLKTGDEAWQEFINGKGNIVSAGPNTGTNIVIKEMFLGYYDPDIYQSFLQPVYVFLGDNDFVGYVQAVKNQYVEGAESISPTTSQ